LFWLDVSVSNQNSLVRINRFNSPGSAWYRHARTNDLGLTITHFDDRQDGIADNDSGKPSIRLLFHLDIGRFLIRRWSEVHGERPHVSKQSFGSLLPLEVRFGWRQGKWIASVCSNSRCRRPSERLNSLCVFGWGRHGHARIDGSKFQRRRVRGTRTGLVVR